MVVAGTTHELADLNSHRTVVEPILPSHLVMPRVDAAVIAGGQGSVQTALASGTPFAGIPLQPEQHLNVHLAQRAGAAQLVTQDEVGSPRLIEAIGELLGSARHREAARRVQAAMAEVDGPGAAADAILELVAA